MCIQISIQSGIPSTNLPGSIGLIAQLILIFLHLAYMHMHTHPHTQAHSALALWLSENLPVLSLCEIALEWVWGQPQMFGHTVCVSLCECVQVSVRVCGNMCTWLHDCWTVWCGVRLLQLWWRQLTKTGDQSSILRKNVKKWCKVAL